MWKAELKSQGEDKHIKLIWKGLSPTESSSRWESPVVNILSHCPSWWGFALQHLARLYLDHQSVVGKPGYQQSFGAKSCVCQHLGLLIQRRYMPHWAQLHSKQDAFNHLYRRHWLCLLVSFCSDTVLFADTVGQSVNTRTVRQEGKVPPP